MATRLWENARERQKFDNLAEFYSIIMATDALENAYISDCVSADEYESACRNLITQFRTAERALLSDGHITSTEEFMSQYRVTCPRAVDRLLVHGAPATLVHGAVESDRSRKHIYDTAQLFVTALDSLHLDLRAVDQIQPRIEDLVNSLNRVPGLPLDTPGRSKLAEWLKELNGMRATEELSEDQIRQLKFDIESADSEFKRFLA